VEQAVEDYRKLGLPGIDVLINNGGSKSLLPPGTCLSVTIRGSEVPAIVGWSVMHKTDDGRLILPVP
jgi:hypothetical protein